MEVWPCCSTACRVAAKREEYPGLLPDVVGDAQRSSCRNDRLPDRVASKRRRTVASLPRAPTRARDPAVAPHSNRFPRVKVKGRRHSATFQSHELTG